ncbi:calcium-binding protein [Mangrovicoccus sp. HB161399]|uniref:calcium-binding protein n=1 Tax=Mangrovicoccus sp. HB161399 TaxID=2720392 RepID=UPI001557EB44|nr:calcium-binding protein [Mangrovicoccus sp. HB161399]
MTRKNAVEELADQLSDTATGIAGALGTIGAVQWVLGEAKDAADAASNFHNDIKDAEEKVEDLKMVVKVLSKFGPAGKIVSLLGKVIDKVEDGIGELRKSAEDTDEAYAGIATAIGGVQKVLSAVELPLDNSAADIGSVLDSLKDAAAAFDIDEGLLDGVQAATLADIRGMVEGLDGSDLGAVQNALDAVAAKAAALVTAANPLSQIAGTLASASAQLSDMISALNPLFSPLGKVADALKPFEWVLDKADWLISKIIDPVLDPILDKTGITGMLQGVADKISGMLPSAGMFGPIDSVAAAILPVLDGGGIEGAAEELKQALTGRLLGEGGILAVLLDEGGDGADLVLGRNDIAGAVSTLLGFGTGDVISAGQGDDILDGGAGNDILVDGAGNDVNDGGAGHDAVFFAAGVAEAEFVFNADGSLSVIHGGETDTVVNAETLIFEDAAFGIDGATAVRTIGHSGGTRALGGTSGHDVLIGGDGDDAIEGYVGRDRIFGGAGNDSLRGGIGTDTLDGGAGDDKLEGGYGADVLSGGAGNDKLRGGMENDTLSGGGGNDKLQGGFNADVLSGGAGDDVLRGGYGRDVLEGGAGADKMSGGAGADTFVFTGADADGARNVIRDFEQGSDVIDLSAMDAVPATDAQDALVFIADAAFSGTAGELRSCEADGRTWVEADLDGDGSADFSVMLRGAPDLGASDFIF